MAVCLAAVTLTSCAARDAKDATVVVSTEGLVAHWAFDDGSDDVLRDSSGNKSDGAIMVAEWVTSDPGCALKFDGVDDYVDCGAGDNLNIEAGGSVVLWFRPEALQGALGSGLKITDWPLVESPTRRRLRCQRSLGERASFFLSLFCYFSGRLFQQGRWRPRPGLLK